MTKKEKRVIGLLKKIEKEGRIYRDRISALKLEIAQISLDPNECTHAHTTPYTWLWDNGYGKQENIIGTKCLSCGSKKAWKSSNNWTKL